MPQESKADKYRRDRMMAAGIRKEAATLPTIHALGDTYAPLDVARALDEHVSAMQEVDRLTAQLKDAIQNERRLEKKARVVHERMKANVQARYGPNLVALSRFGLVPRKKPGPKTPLAKMESAEKNRRTRAAMKTMGKRQKAKAKRGGYPALSS